jgi:hypothetical protein
VAKSQEPSARKSVGYHSDYNSTTYFNAYQIIISENI